MSVGVKLARFRLAFGKSQFLQRLLEESLRDKTQANLLEDVNKSMRGWGSDPFESIEELKRFAPDDYATAIKGIRNRFEWVADHVQFGSHGVRVWRALSVPDPEAFMVQLADSGARGVGIYWSFETRGARPYWSSDRSWETVTLVGEIPDHSINFEETAAANTSTFMSAGEHEIQGHRGKPIWVSAALWNKQEHPVNRWVTL